MAVFTGTAGRYLTERALNRRLRAVTMLWVALVVLVFGLGIAAGYSLARHSLWACASALAAVLIAVPTMVYCGRLFDKQLRQARTDENGASGEREILDYLRQLPDTFTVLSDIDFADSYGNIDHLVIGPSGVFAIDVKDWRGTVAPDGRGDPT